MTATPIPELPPLVVSPLAANAPWWDAHRWYWFNWLPAFTQRQQLAELLRNQSKE